MGDGLSSNLESIKTLGGDSDYAESKRFGMFSSVPSEKAINLDKRLTVMNSRTRRLRMRGLQTSQNTRFAHLATMDAG